MTAVYQFGCSLSINEFQLKRLENEKELEEIYNSYTHHINPFRNNRDTLNFRTFVFAEKNLTEDELKAFEITMNKTLQEFNYRFENALRELRQKRKS